MKGYGQFCPIAMACETWTPLIPRELLFGARRFNEIRQRMPLISRTLLTQLLRELEGADFVKSQPLAQGRGREYRPTPAAEEFREVLERPGERGQRWADVDLVVTADAAAMARVWTGAITFAQAVQSAGLRVEGSCDLVRAFPAWRRRAG